MIKNHRELKMTDRVSWLDTSRGLAFLIVIYAHLQYKNAIVMFYLSPIVLTTFFFISGYLFNTKRTFILVIEQRFRRIIIPFFIYGILMVLSSRIITFSEQNTIQRDFIDLFMQVTEKNDRLWFLPCLFVSTIPFYFIVKHLRSPIVILTTCSFLFVVASIIDLPPYPWHLQLIIPANYFMALGYTYRAHENRIPIIKSPIYLTLLLLCYIAAVTVYWNYSGHSVTFTPTKIVLDVWFFAIFGVYLCVAIAKKIKRGNRYLAFIGANSLIYFALHGKAIALLEKIVNKFLFVIIDGDPTIENLLGFLLTFAVSIVTMIPVIIINKYVPWSIGKGFCLLPAMLVQSHRTRGNSSLSPQLNQRNE